MSQEDRARVVLDVTVRWEKDILTVKRALAGAPISIGACAGSIAQVPIGDRAGFAFAVIRDRDALAILPAGVTARVTRTDEEALVTGPLEIALAAGDRVSIDVGGFEITAAASRPEAIPRGAGVWDRARGGALLHVAAVALIHAWILAASSRSALASSLDVDDGQGAARMKAYLVGAEARSRLAEVAVADGLGEGVGKDVNGAEGNGRAGGGVRAAGSEGAIGAALSRSAEQRRWAVPREMPGDPAPALSREAAREDARSFGMIGLLSSSSATPSATFGDVAAHGLDDLAANGTMWAHAIGESGGAGGLGLAGVGLGGGGDGLGVGLGRIGTLGHTSGEPGPGTGGRGSAALETWGASGWGWGYGCCGGRMGHHVTRAPTIRTGATQVVGRLPPEAIQRIVRQNFGRFRLCYERGLIDHPLLAGRVATRFLIGSDGNVASVADAGSDIADPKVAACVVGAFRGLSFPAPPDGLTVTVTYPISFSPAR